MPGELDEQYVSKTDLLAFKYALHEDFRENCKKFMEFFHKGVKLQHVNSKVEWEIVETYRSPGEEVRVKVKSKKGTNKIITMYNHSDFKVIHVPDAVKVLYGDK